MRTDLLGTTDWRRFVLDALAAEGRPQRELAKTIGKSPPWMSLVLNGFRELSPADAPPIPSFFGLDEEESAYFCALVELDSPSPRARRAAWATVQATQRHRAAEGLRREVALAYSRWYMPAILELASCEGFRAQPDWIADALNPPIPVEQAAEALTTLLRLGLLLPHESGTLVAADSERWSPPELPPGEISEAIASLHEAVLALASRSIRASRYNERHLSSVFVSIPEARYERVVARLRELEREVALLAAEAETGETPNRVYHLGMQFFPVSDFTDSDSES